MEFNRTEAHGVYYATTKWKYYLQGADIIVRNDHKLLTKFLNGRNANNKVNRWGLELATYNITFEWISGACNKAADCLSHLVELPQTTPAPINLLSVTNSDGPTFSTRSQTCNTSLWILPPHSQMLCQKSQKHQIHTKIPDSRQIRSSLTDAED